VPQLGDGAAPDELIRLLRATDPKDLALAMVDTGFTGEEAMATFREQLGGTVDDRSLRRGLRGFGASWVQHVRRVLADPAATRREFVSFLEDYQRRVFAAEQEHVTEPLERAASTMREILTVLTPVEAVERVTGGYTLAANLALKRLTLAPSVFIAP